MSKTLLIVWIVTCALIHANAVVPWQLGHLIPLKDVEGAHLDFWREFGKTDARYLKNDNLIISLEGMMVWFDLPLCIMWLILVIANHSIRYHIQLIVSCFQLFGTSMYFMGAFLRHWTDIAQDASSFWGGFVLGNGIWWIVPFFLIINACTNLTIRQSAIAQPIPVKGRKKVD